MRLEMTKTRIPVEGYEYAGTKRAYHDRMEIQVRPIWKWPDWIKDGCWIAMDKNGDWFFYEEEPSKGDTIWHNQGGRFIRQCEAVFNFAPPPCTDWNKSKRQKVAREYGFIEVDIPDDATIVSTKFDGDTVIVYLDTWKWPEWIKDGCWIAMDESGRWCLYENEPHRSEVLNRWNNLGSSSVMALRPPCVNFTPPHCDDWTNSKRQKPHARQSA